MFTPLFFFLIAELIILILVAGINPKPSHFSKFELARRVDLGDKNATATKNRDNLLVDVVSLQKVLVSLLLIVFVLLAVNVFGWLVGVLVSLLVALEYGAVAKLGVFAGISNSLYNKFEGKIINLIQKAPILFKLIRTMSIQDNLIDKQLSSRQELQFIIDQSGGVLTVDEKKLIVNGLSFGDHFVSGIMTPRSAISSINSSEFLGPLVLNDLHQTGHSHLPVIKGDIDHVVGVLNLQSLLALDIKRSVTAEKAMDPKVFYIRQDQTLQHALSAFLKTHHHLFIVINEFRETVGLLSLNDVIEELLGRKVIDEFDGHDDLRAVALRNPHGNNEPKTTRTSSPLQVKMIEYSL